jgi:hypothetical protein
MNVHTLKTSQIESSITEKRSFSNFEIVEKETSSKPYARCIAASHAVRWAIDKDVIQGRSLDIKQKFLPDGLSKVQDLVFLSPEEKRYLSQIQGRTYANVFHMAERFVNAKVLEISRDYWFGDQTALEALVRFSDEELKHQEMFRQIEQLAGSLMVSGYSFLPNPNEVAKIVLGKSTWAVLALTLHIELITQLHYRQSIGLDENLSPLFKDIFRYHWLEESQHAILDELEWKRCDKTMSLETRDQAVNEFIELVEAVDDLLKTQAVADAEYFTRTCGRMLLAEQSQVVEKIVLKAYRWQHIISGAEHPHFIKVLSSFISDDQGARIKGALTKFL